MNKPHMLRKQVQAGFTLIELVVVIVILGILAATALPKFADMGGDARLAKMQAALGAVKSASATFHAQWLIAGSPAAAATGVKMENADVAHSNGYPTVAGIKVAAGGLDDYNVPAAVGTVLTINADSSHGSCNITYTEATASAAPQFSINATASNCK